MHRDAYTTRRLTTAALAVTVLIASTTPVAAQDDEVGPDDFSLIDLASLPVTMPYEDIASHVVVDVGFGDEEPVPFMFDTGAGTFISGDIQEAHGGEVLQQTQSEAGGGVMITNDLLILPTMDVGGVEIGNSLVNAPWLPEGALSCVTANGLLGAGSLQHAVWQVDYGTQQVTAAATVDELDHIDGAIELDFTPQEGISPTPFVTLPVGDGELTFIVDTGGGIPIVINPADLEAVGIEIPQDAPRSANLVGGAGGSFDAPVEYLQLPITMGDREVVTTVGAGDGFAPQANGNIGHEFLKNFVVTFDWFNDKLYLDPIAEDGSVAPLEDPPGAGLSWEDGQVVVGSVAIGGDADEAGITLGEVVTSVDGVSTEGISLDEFCGFLTSGGHSELTTESGTYEMSPVEGFFEQ